jgi:CheY-like chemotaxis protein
MQIKSVMIIEPDHETRVLVRRVLEDAGHFVISVTRSIDALAMLENISAPHLILISETLPYISGAVFLAHLREQEKFKDVPVAQLLKNGEIPLEGICCTLPWPVEKESILKAVEWTPGCR